MRARFISSVCHTHTPHTHHTHTHTHTHSHTTHTHPTHTHTRARALTHLFRTHTLTSLTSLPVAVQDGIRGLRIARVASGAVEAGSPVHFRVTVDSGSGINFTFRANDDNAPDSTEVSFGGVRRSGVDAASLR